MDGAAQLIALAAGDFQLLPDAIAQLVAVDAPSGGTVVAGGDDLVIADDDRAIVAAAAGGAFQHGLSNIEIVICFINTFHRVPPKRDKVDLYPYYTDFGFKLQVFSVPSEKIAGKVEM